MIIFKEKSVGNDALSKIINLVNPIKKGGNVNNLTKLGISLRDIDELIKVLDGWAGLPPGCKYYFNYPPVVDFLKKNHVQLGVKGNLFYIKD